EKQLDAGGVQAVVKFTNNISSCDVDTRDRLRRDDEPADGWRRVRTRIQNAFVEQFGVCEEERRIPTEQHKARDQTRLRIPRNVVIALNAFDAAEHGRMRAPAVPEKLNHGNRDRKSNTRNGTEYGYARKAHHRKPELPALDAIDSSQVGHFDQADGCGDNDSR